MLNPFERNLGLVFVFDDIREESRQVRDPHTGHRFPNLYSCLGHGLRGTLLDGTKRFDRNFDAS